MESSVRHVPSPSGGGGGGGMVSPVVPRTVPGSSSSPAANRGAVDWSGPSGLVAFASNSLVVAVDPASLQVLQVLDGGHK